MTQHMPEPAAQPSWNHRWQTVSPRDLGEPIPRSATKQLFLCPRTAWVEQLHKVARLEQFSCDRATAKKSRGVLCQGLAELNFRDASGGLLGKLHGANYHYINRLQVSVWTSHPVIAVGIPAVSPSSYQIPLSLPVNRYASSAETARGGSKGSRVTARISRCRLAVNSWEL